MSGIETATAGFKLFGALKPVDEWLSNKLRGTGRKIPNKTIRVISPWQEPWWAMGGRKNEPVMQIVASWEVTNITDEPIRIVSALIIKPKTIGNVMTREDGGTMFGGYDILPRATEVVSADFWIKPPIRKIEEMLCVSVALIDQYGNSHVIKKVLIPGRPKPSLPALPTKERIYSATNPLEKAIIAVLQAEIYRYKDCGRNVGG